MDSLILWLALPAIAIEAHGQLEHPLAMLLLYAGFAAFWTMSSL